MKTVQLALLRTPVEVVGPVFKNRSEGLEVCTLLPRARGRAVRPARVVDTSPEVREDFLVDVDGEGLDAKRPPRPSCHHLPPCADVTPIMLAHTWRMVDPALPRPLHAEPTARFTWSEAYSLGVRLLADAPPPAPVTVSKRCRTRCTPPRGSSQVGAISRRYECVAL